MYIREEDFRYLEGLSKRLDEESRKRFVVLLAKEAGKRTGAEDVGKIQVVGRSSIARG
jgi:hypothetical protein